MRFIYYQLLYINLLLLLLFIFNCYLLFLLLFIMRFAYTGNLLSDYALNININDEDIDLDTDDYIDEDVDSPYITICETQEEYFYYFCQFFMYYLGGHTITEPGDVLELDCDKKELTSLKIIYNNNIVNLNYTYDYYINSLMEKLNLFEKEQINILSYIYFKEDLIKYTHDSYTAQNNYIQKPISLVINSKVFKKNIFKASILISPLIYKSLNKKKFKYI